MKKHKLFTAFLLFAGSMSIFWACKSGSGSENPDFDRTKMLQNIADNLIKPAYSDLQSKVNTLKTANDAFLASPDTSTLKTVQAAWEDAFTNWQFANTYNFGPAGEEGIHKNLAEELGTFPVTAAEIETNITNGTINMTDSNRDARGFLTVEYLIFDLDNDNAKIIDNFSSQNRKDYLQAVVNNIKSRVDEVVTSWNGTYYTTFINNNGTEVGSSTSLLYNEFVKSYETIKNYKVALPLGLQAGQTKTLPTSVEAYYSGKSLKMIKNNITAIENIWYGKAKTGEDGIGFKEYLQAVKNGPELITVIETQLANIHTALNAIPESPAFSVQIQSNITPLTAFSVELQKQVQHFKSDMSSVLGLAITFSSNDGD